MNMRYIKMAYALLVSMVLHSAQIDAAAAAGAGQQSGSGVKIDFKQISSVLNEVLPLIVGAIKGIGGGKAAEQITKFQTAAQKVVQITGQLDKVSADIQQAVAVGKQMPTMFGCLKSTKAQLQKQASAKDTRTLAQVCASIDCANKPDCIRKAIENVRVLLRPLIQDLLIGYADENGVAQQGMLSNVFDLVQQSQLNNEMAPVLDVVKQVDGLLGEVEKLISVVKISA